MNNLWVSLVRGCSCLKERSILEHFDDSVCIRTQTEPSPLPACLACSSCFNRHVHMKCSQLRVTSQRYQQDRHRAGNSRLVRLARFQRRRLCSAVMPALALKHGDVLDDQLTGLGEDGVMSIIGFGSLLSEKSSRFTFPDLQNFRVARLCGFRRVFGHVAPFFISSGIANVDTKEMSSLSVEPSAPEDSIVVALFETPYTKEAVDAWLQREHEYRFLAVRPESLDGTPSPRLAVVCCAFSDEEYKKQRAPGDEFERRYGQFGVDKIWRDDVLPCRTYLRHCALSAQALSSEAHVSFLDNTYLADRKTTVRQHLDANPEILEELPPPHLAERYCGS